MKSKNLTISLDEDLLNAGKRYAKRKGTSINQLFREFLESRVLGTPVAQDVDDLMDALDGATGDSKGRRWKREDAYSK